jgi:hypothetical protein
VTSSCPPSPGSSDKFNTMPKYVVSSTLRDPAWTNTTVLDGDVPEAVGRLRETFDGVFPVVLGSGKRLFADTSEKKAPLRLTDSRAVGDGVMILTYAPALGA